MIVAEKFSLDELKNFEIIRQPPSCLLHHDIRRLVKGIEPVKSISTINDVNRILCLSGELATIRDDRLYVSFFIRVKALIG